MTKEQLRIQAERINVIKDQFNPQSCTSAELAAVIAEDARDTKFKLIDLTEVLGELNNIDVGLSLDKSQVETIYQALDLAGNEGYRELTWVNASGQVIHIRCERIGTHVDGYPAIDLYVTKEGVENKIISANRVSAIFDVDTELDSLADQLQSCNLMEMLAEQARSGSVSVSTLSAALSTIVDKLRGENASFYASVLSLGDSLNACSLTAVLKDAYYSLRGAVGKQNAIEFNDTNFQVKSFFGTVVWDAILTGVDVLANVLMNVGNITVKIVGTIISGIPAAIRTLNSYDLEKSEAVIKVDAMRQEFAQPVGRRKGISASLLSEGLRALINEKGAVILKYPFCNIYLWRDYDYLDERYSFECYLSMINKAQFTGTTSWTGYDGLWNNDFSFRDGTATTYNYAVRASVDLAIPMANTFSVVAATNFGGQDNNTKFYGPIPPEMTDYEATGYVFRNISLFIWSMVQVYTANSSFRDDYADGNGFYILSSNYEQPASQMPIPETYINKIVDLMRRGGEITWAEIVNNIIPDIQNWFNTITSAPPVLQTLFGTNPKSYASSCVFFALPIANTNSSFAITPPEWERGSMIAAAITIPIATAAASAVIIGVTTGIRRWAMGKIADKQLEMNDAYMKYKDTRDPLDRKAYINKSIQFQRFSQWFNCTLVAPFSSQGMLAYVGETNTGILGQIFGDTQEETNEEIEEVKDSIENKDVNLDEVIKVITGSSSN